MYTPYIPCIACIYTLYSLYQYLYQILLLLVSIHQYLVYVLILYLLEREAPAARGPPEGSPEGARQTGLHHATSGRQAAASMHNGERTRSVPVWIGQPLLRTLCEECATHSWQSSLYLYRYGHTLFFTCIGESTSSYL